MKVLVLTTYDWANTGYRFSKCLEHLGYEVTAYKGREYHKQWPVLYPHQMSIHKALQNKSDNKKPPLFAMYSYAPELKELMSEHDVIHFTSTSFIDTGLNLAKKKMVVNYSGGTYRQNSKRVSNFFNQFANASLIQCPDLLNLGAKNEYLIYYPVDTNFIKPVFNKLGTRLRFSHFPSAPANKGTQLICKVMDQFSNKLNYTGTRELTNQNYYKHSLLNWEDNLKRMADCDVYIETIQPTIKGKRFGEWGNTTLEAAALGKIVISNTFFKDLYQREYGDSPLLIANDEKQLKDRINQLISMSETGIYCLQQQFRQWAEDKHSIPATAMRLYDKIYKTF